jgi:hypothetical protein
MTSRNPLLGDEVRSLEEAIEDDLLVQTGKQSNKRKLEKVNEGEEQ